MNDPMNDSANDKDLRALIRAADPAADLPSADPTRVARLLEETMSHDTLQPERRTGTSGRNSLTWLVAAAAVVLIGVGGTVALMGGDDNEPADLPVAQGTTTAPPVSDEPAPSDDGATGEPTDGPALTRLAVPGPNLGRCAMPTAQLLAQQDLAFAGTVTAVADGVATLTPNTVYVGEAAAQIEVAAPGAEMNVDVAAVNFEVGVDYLVASTDGAVAVCGLSGPADPMLQQLYDEAFTG